MTDTELNKYLKPRVEISSNLPQEEPQFRVSDLPAYEEEPLEHDLTSLRSSSCYVSEASLSSQDNDTGQIEKSKLASIHLDRLVQNEQRGYYEEGKNNVCIDTENHNVFDLESEEFQFSARLKPGVGDTEQRYCSASEGYLDYGREREMCNRNPKSSGYSESEDTISTNSTTLDSEVSNYLDSEVSNLEHWEAENRGYVDYQSETYKSGTPMITPQAFDIESGDIDIDSNDSSTSGPSPSPSSGPSRTPSPRLDPARGPFSPPLIDQHQNSLDDCPVVFEFNTSRELLEEDGDSVAGDDDDSILEIQAANHQLEQVSPGPSPHIAFDFGSLPSHTCEETDDDYITDSNTTQQNSSDPIVTTGNHPLPECRVAINLDGDQVSSSGYVEAASGQWLYKRQYSGSYKIPGTDE